MEESEKLLSDLRKLASQDSLGKKSPPTYSIYVIEIEKIDPNLEFDFYVGSTGNPIQHRFSQHVPGHKLAAKIFRHSKAHALRIRWDLISDFPKFHTKTAAEKAEGLLARAIHRAGWTVCSDRLDKDWCAKTLPSTLHAWNIRISPITIHAATPNRILFEVKVFRIGHPVDDLSEGANL